MSIPETLHITKGSPHLAYDDINGGDCHLLANNEKSEPTLARAVECFNACAGIPDPAAAIQAARDSMQKVIATLARAELFSHERDLLEHSLKLLTPQP